MPGTGSKYHIFVDKAGHPDVKVCIVVGRRLQLVARARLGVRGHL